MGLVTIWYSERFDRIVECDCSMFHCLFVEMGYKFIGVL